MTKPETITLLQCDNDDDLYIVDQLVNRCKPQVGKILRAVEVEKLMYLRDTKVIIKRART